MQSQTLYRKYRPSGFSQIIGQKHIVRTLKNALKNGRLGQAYLFTGPRGTGKTTLARILAKSANCQKPAEGEACDQCPSCLAVNSGKTLDIIEIDAASNTGVDNIRELKENIVLPPTFLKFKVYIIDEVHMLSAGAFNALLKTLEEPPAHAIFILATTEIHKIPETILSRCQRFDFSKLPPESIIEKLSFIAKKEKIKIEKEALEMIALAAEGGMRDAESLLGQIISLEDKEITAKEAEEILGTTDRQATETFAGLLIEEKTSKAIDEINRLSDEGYDLEIFAKSLINYLRQILLLTIDPEMKKNFNYEATAKEISAMEKISQKTEVSKILEMIDIFSEARKKIASSVVPQLPLEMAVIRITGKIPSPLPPEKIQKQTLVPEENPKNPSSKTDPEPEKISRIEKGQELEELKNKPLSEESLEKEKTKKIEGLEKPENFKEIDSETVRSRWKKLLVEIRPFNHSLCALLSTCQIRSVEKNRITLATPYDFYQEKLNDPQNRLTIEEVLGKILGSQVKINTITDKTILPQKSDLSDEACGQESSPGHQDPLLDSALEIMGGKVVKE